MAQTRYAPLQFRYVVYPLWRRKLPLPLKLLAQPLLHRYFPAAADHHPPATPAEMARFLVRWHIFDNLFVDEQTITRGIASVNLSLTYADHARAPQAYTGGKVRIPAQWEPMQKVLISWAILYPPLWTMHAQMAEAISQVADVEILVPSALWARAVWMYLSWRGHARMEHIHTLVLPTNDVWIRDYGPILAIDANQQLVALNHIYDPLPLYPQQDDDAMPARWSAQHEIPLLNYDLHTEGGNLWTDGAGTLLISERIFYANPYYDRDALEDYLHRFLDFEKLIITPRVAIEETGHIDLLTKLASADTVLISAPTSFTSKMALTRNKRLYQRERNAQGQPYNIVELPTPPLYFNWLAYPIRRSYTNALTINGSVLVPTFDIPEDDIALKVYEQAMPDYRIVPIDCAVAINGGGAVHCMTKEVPLV